MTNGALEDIKKLANHKNGHNPVKLIPSWDDHAFMGITIHRWMRQIADTPMMTLLWHIIDDMPAPIYGVMTRDLIRAIKIERSKEDGKLNNATDYVRVMQESWRATLQTSLKIYASRADFRSLRHNKELIERGWPSEDEVDDMRSHEVKAHYVAAKHLFLLLDSISMDDWLGMVSNFTIPEVK